MSIAEKFEVIADAVYEKGRRDEYDKFWDVIQSKGNEVYYRYTFYFTGWTDEIYNPKYPIKFKALQFTFAASLITDTKVDIIADSTLSDLSGTFYNNTSLKKIRNIVFDEKTTFGSTAFQGCTALETINVGGTIGQSGFNIRWSTKLTKDSLLPILTALSKDSTIASGKSITFATVHQAVIEADSDCLEQLNLAINAGWTVAYA